VTKAEFKAAYAKVARKAGRANAKRLRERFTPEQLADRMRRVAMARWHPGSESDHAAGVGAEHVTAEVAAQGGE